jgi:O-succinylbenzoate synthase
MIHARLYEFMLPLKKPLTTGVDTRSRSGFLIALSDDQGRTGWGEASPLPGLSVDNLERVQLEWANIKPQFEELEIPSHLDLEYLKFLGEKLTSPALRFGVEVAWLRLMSARGDQAWPLLLNPDATEVVECNALISGSAETWPAQLARILDQGFCKVKIKMGRGTLSEELNAFTALAESAASQVEWRIDANRAWTLSETCTVLTACQGIPLEYFEEPLINPKDWPEALKLPNAKLALDEQLQSLRPNQLGGYSDASAIILKPTFLGGIAKCWEWAAAAQQHGMACTLSSCFESGCGLLAIAELHSALPGVQLAVGLDTHQWLGGDTLSSPFSVHRGVVEWPRGANGGPVIDIDRLKEVA